MISARPENLAAPKSALTGEVVGHSLETRCFAQFSMTKDPSPFRKDFKNRSESFER